MYLCSPMLLMMLRPFVIWELFPLFSNLRGEKLLVWIIGFVVNNVNAQKCILICSKLQIISPFMTRLAH